MDNLKYSTDGLNARKSFFGVDTVIYVEGDDDILFWDAIFHATSSNTFVVESAGGVEELKKLVKEIEEGRLEGIVARDLDYSSITGKESKNPRVISTYGYSIENTLYTSAAIYSIVKAWSKNPSVTLTMCENWLQSNFKKIYKLLVLDLADIMEGAGVGVLGDNCQRFFVGKTGASFCQNKIDIYYSECQKKISVAGLSNAMKLIANDIGLILRYTRGHFIASGICRLIVEQAKLVEKRASVPSEALYSNAIVYIENNFNSKHPHFDHYSNVIQNAFASIIPIHISNRASA